MYSYNIGKMSIIYLGNNKKKIQEVYLRELMRVFYDKNTSDRLKRLNQNHTFKKSKTKEKISHINIDEQND
jgi:hypothetical protein